MWTFQYRSEALAHDDSTVASPMQLNEAASVTGGGRCAIVRRMGTCGATAPTTMKFSIRLNRI